MSTLEFVNYKNDTVAKEPLIDGVVPRKGESVKINGDLYDVRDVLHDYDTAHVLIAVYPQIRGNQL